MSAGMFGVGKKIKPQPLDNCLNWKTNYPPIPLDSTIKY